MKRYSVIYSPAAWQDLRSIAAYISFALNAPAAAKRQVSRIRNDIRSLETLPLRYARVENSSWSEFGVRRMPVNRYLVFYRVDEASASVIILRIVYGGRDLNSISLEEPEE